MTKLDFDDEQVRQLLREELDRRELEKQKKCNHRASGTINIDLTIECNQCGKVLGEEDRDNKNFSPSAPLIVERAKVWGK